MNTLNNRCTVLYVLLYSHYIYIPETLHNISAAVPLLATSCRPSIYAYVVELGWHGRCLLACKLGFRCRPDASTWHSSSPHMNTASLPSYTAAESTVTVAPSLNTYVRGRGTTLESSQVSNPSALFNQQIGRVTCLV